MKKLSCDLLLTCDQTILSKDNKISLIGIFDQIFLPEIPSSHPKLSLVGLLSGEPYTDHHLTLKLTNYPDQNISVNLGTTGKSNLVAEFINLPIRTSGIYTFSLFSGKTLLAQSHLSISKLPTSPARSKVINWISPYFNILSFQDV